jgi:hypothetical protein
MFHRFLNLTIQNTMIYGAVFLVLEIKCENHFRRMILSSDYPIGLFRGSIQSIAAN